jgi:hypothetical protein
MRTTLASTADRAFLGRALGAPATLAPMPPSPCTVNVADNLECLNLAVDRLLPVHGRLLPIADPHTAVSHAH